MAGNTSIVKRFYDAYNSGDPDFGAEIMESQVTTVVPGIAPMEGPEPFQAYLAAFKNAAPDSQMSMDSVTESDDVVVVEGVFTGTQSGPLVSAQGEVPPTGRKFAFNFACKFQLSDGLIRTHNVYFDQVALLSQLGLMPSPGGQ
ncbi:MAG: ester cyclase [Actinomycetota bacterium]|nr:ester cyclase [Actinomycetota bacterium]